MDMDSVGLLAMLLSRLRLPWSFLLRVFSLLPFLCHFLCCFILLNSWFVGRRSCLGHDNDGSVREIVLLVLFWTIVSDWIHDYFIILLSLAAPDENLKAFKLLGMLN